MSPGLPEVTAFSCSALGVAGTTQVFVRKVGENYVARVGIAILGQTNMKEGDLRGANPFDDSFYDNFAEGIGPTQEAAIDNLKKDIQKTSETLWL